MWATRGIAPWRLLGALVDANDHDHVPVLALRLREAGKRLPRGGVQRIHGLYPERRRDPARRRAGVALGVHDGRRGALLGLGERRDVHVGLRVAVVVAQL